MPRLFRNRCLAYNKKMPYPRNSIFLMLCGVFCLITAKPVFAKGSSIGFEIFAKGSYSKNNISADIISQSVTGTTGLAIGLGSSVRLEARMSLIEGYQNRMELTNVNGEPWYATSIHTQSLNYTLGVDIDFLSDKSAFRPFIFIGAGYVENKRTYSFDAHDYEEKRFGVSGNGGLGFRVMLAKSIAFETEGLAVATGIDKPGPLIDYYLTFGIRLFL